MAPKTRTEAIAQLMKTTTTPSKATQVLIRWNNGEKTIGTFRSEMAKNQFLGMHKKAIESTRPTFVDHVMDYNEINAYLQELAF